MDTKPFPRRFKKKTLTEKELTGFEPAIQKVCWSFRTRLNRRNIGSSDFAQEIRLQLWKYGKTFDPKKGTKETYVYRIAQHLLAGGQKRRREKLAGFEEMFQYGKQDDEIEKKAFHTQRRDRLRAITGKKPLRKLAPVEREAIQRFLKGGTYRGIYAALFPDRKSDGSNPRRFFQDIFDKLRPKNHFKKISRRK